MYNILYILTLLFSFILSAPVSITEANKVSENVYNQFNLDKRFSYSIKDVQIIKDADIDLIYIYHLNPNGYILVSADDRSEPYLGYSFTSNFRTSNMPESFYKMFDNLKNTIKNPILNNVVQSDNVKSLWNTYKTENYRSTEVRNVSPLLDAEFDQSGSWNDALSAFGFYGPVGCVAVSMSQIMHYWSYPESGTGSNTYVEDNFGSLTADFENAYYDFSSMAATYATAPSKLLLYHTGISVNMDYDNSGSGAQVEGVYPSAEDAFQRYFKFSDDIRSVSRDDYDSDTEFRTVLKEELDNSRPILHSGYSNSDYDGGHAWNVDGYQNNNMHCNWGWGGWNNGYYTVTSMMGMSYYQTCLIKVIPDPFTNPFALFAYEIDENTVILIDLSSELNETNIQSLNWDFGDGNTLSSSDPYVEYTYSGNGEYTVQLSITNIYGYTGDPHIETITIGSSQAGDINTDDIVNVLDLVMLVNFVLNDNPTNAELNAADLNNDGILNVLDVVSLVNIILEP
tara:strand:+ start:1054 stop:2586 length:1533 start_codon:yes stop_codon:yes gene_type:complete